VSSLSERLWLPVLPEHVQRAFLTLTRKRHLLLAVSSPILDINGAPQVHPSLKFAVYSFVQTPLAPLPLNGRCSLWPRVQTRGATQTRWCQTAQAMSGVCQLMRSDLGPHHSICTGQPRKPTIVRDLATLWEQQCTNRVLWHDDACNPHIKGPRMLAL
jgi:hypothetical protein